MNGLFRKWCKRWAAVILPAVILALGHLPAWAVLRASNFADGEGPFSFDENVGTGDLEGDPLDGNDTGGGDVPDPRYVETNDRAAPGLHLPVRFDGRRIYLIPMFKGSTLIFQILFIDAPVDAREG